MTYDFIMEWNTKTPYQWEWENLVTFNGNTNEVSGQSQPINWEAEVDGAIDSVSLFSSGCCPSSSNFGIGSSSKSSISVSFDSSTKGGIKIPEFNFEDPNKKKELGGVEDNGSSSTLPLLGLKLGKRTYFEDVCAGNIVKPPSLSVIPKLSVVSTKRSRSTYHSMQTPRCQVEGCDLDLTSAKDYHRRHRVCDRHTKYPKVTISGLERRFCQQCSRFHDLSEFDEKKRSCRRRLSDHNARRRKPAGEAMQLNSARRSSSLYDGRHPMSFLTNRVPIFHITKPATNTTWGKTCQKLEDNTQHLSSSHDLHNSIPLLTPNFDRVLSFKGTTKDIFHEGTEASTLDKSTDLWHALSLLSFNSGDPEKTSFQQLIHGNNSTSMAHQAVPDNQGWSLTSLEYW